MARPLDLDKLVDHFILVDDELDLLRHKTGATRLGFGVILKLLVWKGRSHAVGASLRTTRSNMSLAR